MLGGAGVVDVFEEVLGEDHVHAAVVERDPLADVPHEVGGRHDVDVEEAVDAVLSAADLDAGGLVVDPAVGPGCEYFLAEYLAGQATNNDAVENIDVMWVPGNSLTRFIAVDTIFPPILAALEEQT